MKRKIQSPKKLVAILFSLLVVILGSIVLPFIPIQNDVKELFVETEDQTQKKQKINSSFENPPKILILTIREDKKLGFQSKEKLQNIQLLTDSLLSKSYFDTVLSIVAIKTPKLVGSSLFFKPIINLDKSHLDSSDWNYASRFSDLTPLFINDNWSLTNIFITLPNNVEYHDSLTTQIENTANYFGFKNAKVIGNSVFDNEIKTRVEKDIFRLALYGFIIIMAAFWVFFRSFQVIIFIGWMVGINVNASILFIWLLDVEFNIMTAVIPTLIAILSVTDLNHILHIYKENSHIEDVNKRINSSLKTINYALIMTSLTTAIGFAIFLLSDVKTIFDFGIIAILSIGFALFTAWYIAPSFLSIIPHEKIKLLSVKKTQTLIMQLVSQHPKKLTLLFLVLFLLTGTLSIQNWNINYIIYDDLEKKSPLEISYKQFNDDFQGTRQIEIILTAAKDSVLNLENILLLDTIENYLKQDLGYRYTNSYTNFIKTYVRTINKGNPEFYQLPKDLETMKLGLKRVNENVDSNLLHQYVSKDGKSLKIIAFTQEIVSSEGIQQLDSLQSFLAEITQCEKITFSLQGSGYSRDYSTMNISKTIIYGIFISIGIISLIMAITFQSILVGFIAWLVNILPVFASISILFLLGYHITPAIAMMLSISFGIALDDTIYFLGRLKSEQKNITKESLLENIASITFPVLSTSIILSLSFCALFFSSFSFNITNGLIIICTLLIAMICDLLFLPTLLYVFKKR